MASCIHAESSDALACERCGGTAKFREDASIGDEATAPAVFCSKECQREHYAAKISASLDVAAPAAGVTWVIQKTSAWRTVPGEPGKPAVPADPIYPWRQPQPAVAEIKARSFRFHIAEVRPVAGWVFERVAVERGHKKVIRPDSYDDATGRDVTDDEVLSAYLVEEIDGDARYDVPRNENIRLLDGQVYSIIDDESVLTLRETMYSAEDYVLYGHDDALAPENVFSPNMFKASTDYFSWYRGAMPFNADIAVRKVDRAMRLLVNEQIAPARAAYEAQQAEVDRLKKIKSRSDAEEKEFKSAKSQALASKKQIAAYQANVASLAERRAALLAPAAGGGGAL